MTPKEAQVLRSVGERAFQNREKNKMASPTMVVQLNEIWEEMGTLHFQVQQANKRLGQANHRIAQLEAENKKLKVLGIDPPAPKPELVPEPTRETGSAPATA